MNCIQHFSRKDILESHKPNCMLVNGKQAVDLPKKDSKIKFTNLQRLVPVPFIIYADLEALLIPVQNCTPNNDKSYTLKTHNIKLVRMDIKLFALKIISFLNHLKCFVVKIVYISSLRHYSKKRRK